jgi:hypothetical protein
MYAGYIISFLHYIAFYHANMIYNNENKPEKT